MRLRYWHAGIEHPVHENDRQRVVRFGMSCVIVAGAEKLLRNLSPPYAAVICASLQETPRPA
ncbi:hypothetical protein [Xanthomonas arboricola]|uniref:hypothetical protein n=1 Tax=Xanthomonas arboricola TaxID=56448 RepID=UPI00141AAC80|nr:hypothetical protein [Xanthomonas arboricola]NIK51350.1 hypothetical protein [Xanthomonas arboricola]